MMRSPTLDMRRMNDVSRVRRVSSGVMVKMVGGSRGGSRRHESDGGRHGHGGTMAGRRVKGRCRVTATDTSMIQVRWDAVKRRFVVREEARLLSPELRVRREISLWSRWIDATTADMHETDKLIYIIIIS